MVTNIDDFRQELYHFTAPPRHVKVITPSDSEPLANATRAIRANTAGVIKVETVGSETTLANFLAGETRIMCVTKIWATGTTVSGDIEAMW